MAKFIVRCVLSLLLPILSMAAMPVVANAQAPTITMVETPMATTIMGRLSAGTPGATQWRLTFSTDVMNVGVNDFTISLGHVLGPIPLTRNRFEVEPATASATSDDVWTINLVAPVSDGAYTLTLNNSHDIMSGTAANTRLANNALNAAGGAPVINLDAVSPTIESVTATSVGSAMPITGTFRVRFSEPVMGVNTNSFTLAGGSTNPVTSPMFATSNAIRGISPINGFTQEWEIRFTATPAYTASVNQNTITLTESTMNTVATDRTGNTLAPTSNPNVFTHTILQMDDQPPMISDFERAGGSSETTDQDILQWTVTIADNSGVDVQRTHFHLHNGTQAMLGTRVMRATVSINQDFGNTYTVSARLLSGNTDGNYVLVIPADTLRDQSPDVSGGNAVPMTVSAQHYAVSRVPTVLNVIRVTDNGMTRRGEGTDGDETIRWRVVFSEPVTGVTDDDFIAHNGTAAVGTTTINAMLSTDPSQYVVETVLPVLDRANPMTIDLVATSDSLGIQDMDATPQSFVSTANTILYPRFSLVIGSEAYRFPIPSTPTPGPTTPPPTGPAPRVTSITYNDTNSNFDVQFSEPVTGVTPAHFEIDFPSSGVMLALSGSGDTYTLTPLPATGYLRIQLANDVSGIVDADMNALQRTNVNASRPAGVSSIAFTLTNATDPYTRPSTRTGADANTSAGNVQAIVWTITYDGAVPDATNSHYSAACINAENNNAMCGSARIEAVNDTTNATTTHVVTATINTARRSNNLNYTLSSNLTTNAAITAAGMMHIVHLDTLPPQVNQSLTVNPTNNQQYTIGFNEAVENLSPADFMITVSGMPARIATAADLPTLAPSGTPNGTTWTITLATGVMGNTLSFNPTTNGMGAIDAAGNPVSGGSQAQIIQEIMMVVSSQVQQTAQTYIASTPQLVNRIARTTPSRQQSRTTTQRNNNNQNFAMNASDNNISMRYSGQNQNFSFTKNPTTENIEYSASLPLSGILDSIADSILGKPSSRRYRSSSSGNSASRRSSTPSFSDVGLWIQATYSAFENSNTQADGNSYLIHTGIDADIGANFIAGIMMQLDQTKRETPMRTNVAGSIASDFEGSGWLVGPYIAGRGYYTPLSFEGRISYGTSSNEIMYVAQPSSSYDTQRWLAAFEFSDLIIRDFYGWDMGSNVEYSYYSEQSDAFMGLAGTTIPETEYTLNRISLGRSLSRNYAYRDGSIMTPILSFSGLYSQDNSQNTDELTGKLDATLNFSGRSGLNWNVGGYYEGIGADITSYGISGGVRIAF